MLRTRIITGTIGVAAVLLLLLWGSLPWHITVWVATMLATIEFTAMLRLRWWQPLSVWAYVLMTVVLWWPHWSQLFIFQIMIAIALLIPVLTKNRFTMPESAALLIGALYIGYGGESLTLLRDLHRGWAWLLLLLICIWMTDSVAYFVGRYVQGPKLWPSVSPSKTISGAVGGLVGSVIGSVVFGMIALPGHSIASWVLCGLVISVTGQIGDLIESAYKRSTGVKDSGQLLPGHGGMLDRVDSLLFAAPFALHFITAFLASK